jgi:hypothetical protein
MPYFPSEQDWTLITRPARIPLEERFPDRYAGTNPQNGKTRQPAAPPKPPRTNPPRNQTTRDVSNNRENPNLIPLNRTREGGEPPRANCGALNDVNFLTELEYENTDGWNTEPREIAGW